MGVMFGLALGLLGILLLARLFVHFIVPSFVFFPEPLQPQESHPKFWGFSDASEVWIPSGDGLLLHGWWFPARSEQSSVGTIVFFHGNAGHLGDCGAVAASLANLGLDVLLPDYRGFGLSEGKASEEGLYTDARFIYRWLVDVQAINPHQLIVVGHSLGSAVAADLAVHSPLAAVVMLGAFTHTPAIARHRFSYLPAWYLEWDLTRFDSLVRVPRINIPILFGVGSEDRVIPPQEARELFKVAHSPKQWLSITGAGHNDIFDYEELWKELHRFIYTILIGKPSNN